MPLIVLKERITFLLGFGVGFCITLLIFLMQYSFILKEPSCDKELFPDKTNILSSLGNPNFLANQNILGNPNFLGLSNEAVKFGAWLKETSKVLTETDAYDDWIKAQNGELEGFSFKSNGGVYNVHLTCVVFVENLKMAKAASETWGTHCNKTYFFGQNLEDSSIPVIKLKSKLKSSWQFLCESMNYIWNLSKEKNEHLQWIIFVKDDTMVLPENLRYMVSPLNYDEDYYLGHAVSLWGQNYNVAQAGYVLSKSAFEKIVEKFDSSKKCSAGGKFWKKEDFYLGKHLASMGIRPSDTRDSYKRGTFHGYSLKILFWGVAKPGQYWTKALYPPGPDCCSPGSVTFSATDASKIYTLNYLLYHLNTFLKPKTSSAKSTSKSDDEVWKSVLKEEFGINNMTAISSDQYYQLWKSKYSSPEMFLKNKLYNPFSDSSESSKKLEVK